MALCANGIEHNCINIFIGTISRLGICSCSKVPPFTGAACLNIRSKDSRCRICIQKMALVRQSCSWSRIKYESATFSMSHSLAVPKRIELPSPDLSEQYELEQCILLPITIIERQSMVVISALRGATSLYSSTTHSFLYINSYQLFYI